MLGSEFQDMLRCIRCGACMNHCPVYQAVGGHAYGWVYPGPMGAVLTPTLIGVDKAGHLPNASTFCGRCESVCPMKIPLPKMMRHWREREFERHLSPATWRWGLGLWALFAAPPAALPVWHEAGDAGARQSRRRRAAASAAAARRRLDQHRDLPAPQGQTFQEMWAERRKAIMSGRDAVLGKIRRSLGVTGEEPSRNATVDNRLRTRPRGVVPARGQLPPMPSASPCSSGWRKPPRRAWRASPMRPTCRRRSPTSCAGTTCRRRCAWATTSVLPPCRGMRPRSRCATGRRDGNDAVAVGHAFAGVAETGTLVLTSGTDNPTTLNFLPETAIVVIDAADIAGDYETVWDRLRAADGNGALPRTVNLITGPSRSADIEQTLLLGAHGPRSLHIVVVG